MDSFVSNDGRTIVFKITDNYSEKPKMIHGEEYIGRFIHFYENDDAIKMRRIWGTYDKMQNISAIDAKAYFEND